jgi:hypothetical protein
MSVLLVLFVEFQKSLMASSACSFISHIWAVDTQSIFFLLTIWHFILMVLMSQMLSAVFQKIILYCVSLLQLFASCCVLIVIYWCKDRLHSASVILSKQYLSWYHVLLFLITTCFCSTNHLQVIVVKAYKCSELHVSFLIFFTFF